MAFFDEFQHLKIQLEDIKSATNNFGGNNLIRSGGFGKVYKGEISHSKGRSMVAFKRLDTSLGQGNSEFWREIVMLSRYTHENLVSLLGYCDEGGEKILVYEYASRGSLDRHLSDTTALTWMQRIKICLGVARGLTYLHDPTGTQQRVIHRDIKSANILLDENWNAKVSDMGLSKIGPANQQHTALVTNAVGTLGYLDPMYLEMSVLTKESDVYSFGAVLFEVMCGRLCYEYSNSQCRTLVRKLKKSYKQKKLDEVIANDLLQQMDESSLGIFSDIAYQCLQRSLEERPTMAHVVEKLEIALELQEIYEEPVDHERIIKTAVTPQIYGSKEELDMLLSKGILINKGRRWFSLNKNGEPCEMISAAECKIPIDDGNSRGRAKYKSRFPQHGSLTHSAVFNAHVRAQCLSPGITYTVNLVFKPYDPNYLSKPLYFGLKYKLKGETNSSISYLAYGREDGLMMIELYQFTSDKRTFNLDIQFEGKEIVLQVLTIEGIEFRPINKVQHEAAEDDDDNVEMQPTSDDSSLDWEQKLPNDYEEIIMWSKDSIELSTTKKELYFLFRKGFLINNGEEWVSLAKNGKKCYMISARAALVDYAMTWQSLPESRFEGATFNHLNSFTILCKIKSQMLSSQTTYECYLVYKFQENFGYDKPLKVKDGDFRSNDGHLDVFWFIYLVTPQTPFIRPRVDQNTHNPSDIPKIKGLPRMRNDGWMEVQVWEFQSDNTTEDDRISMYFVLSNHHKKLDGIIIQGYEFKPV